MNVVGISDTAFQFLIANLLSLRLTLVRINLQLFTIKIARLIEILAKAQNSYSISQEEMRKHQRCPSEETGTFSSRKSHDKNLEVLSFRAFYFNRLCI